MRRRQGRQTRAVTVHGENRTRGEADKVVCAPLRRQRRRGGRGGECGIYTLPGRRRLGQPASHGQERRREGWGGVERGGGADLARGESQTRSCVRLSAARGGEGGGGASVASRGCRVATASGLLRRDRCGGVRVGGLGGAADREVVELAKSLRNGGSHTLLQQLHRLRLLLQKARHHGEGGVARVASNLSTSNLIAQMAERKEGVGSG